MRTSLYGALTSIRQDYRGTEARWHLVSVTVTALAAAAAVKFYRWVFLSSPSELISLEITIASLQNP